MHLGPILIMISLFSVTAGIKENKEHKVSSSWSADILINRNTQDTVFQTEKLVIVRLSPHVYQHISFLNAGSFGRVPSNGTLIVNEKQAVIFDTPADDEGSVELINFVSEKLKSKIIAVIPTHFHEDCVGGMSTFNKHEIPAYASNRTITLLKNKGNKYASTLHGFKDQLILKIGEKEVIADYVGEGHTKDNIIGYFPSEKVMFGGCLIKELGADKGNLEDANTGAWPLTVTELKKKYSKTKIVIPGHGAAGGMDLLDYTIQLFN